MSDDVCAYREALNATDAFLDCARYNDGGDAIAMRVFLERDPSLLVARDEQGRTALHMAAANGHADVLRMLLEFGPLPDVPNHEGNTALHFAALNNQALATRLLLEHGWRPMARNAAGQTPIQMIYGKRFEMIEALLLERDEELDTYAAQHEETGGEKTHTPSASGSLGTTEGTKPSVQPKRTTAAAETQTPTVAAAAHTEEVKVEAVLEKETVRAESQTPNEDPKTRLGSANVDGVE